MRSRIEVRDAAIQHRRSFAGDCRATLAMTISPPFSKGEVKKAKDEILKYSRIGVRDMGQDDHPSPRLRVAGNKLQIPLNPPLEKGEGKRTAHFVCWIRDRDVRESIR